MTGSAATAEALAEGVARMERSARRARPVLGAALLVAAVSLGFTIWLLIQQADLVQRLEVSERRATASDNAVRAMAAQLGAEAAIATSNRSNLRQQEIARARVRELLAQIPAPATNVTAPSVSPLAGTQLLTVGDAGGWDVDILWCTVPQGAQSYANGRAAAIALANRAAGAQNGNPLRLGRIRLLSIRPQDTPNWRVSMRDHAFLVAADAALGETGPANAILAMLPQVEQGAFVVDQPTLPGNQAPSRYYMSVVSCLTD